jgi:hypothetical protein
MLPPMKYKDQNRNLTFPFMENPDNRDVTIFTMLMVMKLFAQQKGRALSMCGRQLLVGSTARSTRALVIPSQ